MKHQIKIYLEPFELEGVKRAAAQVGLTGRGSLSRFIAKTGTEQIIFLDENTRKILGLFNLKESERRHIK